MGISILIPAFRPTFLRQAICSALGQELEDFELIISDDSGGDQIRPIVERFSDPRIRYRPERTNTGSYADGLGPEITALIEQGLRGWMRQHRYLA